MTIEGSLAATSGVTLNKLGAVDLRNRGRITGNARNGSFLFAVAVAVAVGGGAGGSFARTAGGTLVLHLDNRTTIDGGASPAGTLVVALGTAVFDQRQLSFDLTSASRIVGDFATIDLTGLAVGYATRTDIFEDEGGDVYRLTATAVPEQASVVLLVAGRLQLSAQRLRQALGLAGKPTA